MHLPTLLLTGLSATSQLLVAAHFVLNYPPSIGFSDDDEGTAICGNFAPDFAKDNVTDFHVDGDVVAARTVHPQTTYLVRAMQGTTLSSGSGNAFATLAGPLQQTNIGDLCLPSVRAPGNWTGSRGIINVIADGPDGLLYQCAAVNFVAGSRDAGAAGGQQGGGGPACTNSSGISVVAVQDEKLTGATTVNAVDGQGEKKNAAGRVTPFGWAAVSWMDLSVVAGFLGAASLAL